MQNREPTLARRYIFKLLANLASVPVYLIMEAILPRALGPQMYGNYSFATNFFQQVSGFLDLGTSTCFYNALSRRQQEIGLIAFYTRVVALVGIAVILLAIMMQSPALGNLLMPGVPLWLAPLAAVWAFLTWLGRVLRSMNDAVGATVQSETIRTAVSLLAVGLLCILFFIDKLDLTSLFAQQYTMLIATAIGYWLVSCKHAQSAGYSITFAVESNQIRAYSREFFDYSHPLFVQALLSFLMLASERWLLQWFDGSTEQGFFALSQKVSIACFLFVSAMTPLVMRELSVAWGKGDLQSMARLVNRFAPMLYVIAAYFSCFTLAEGPALVQIFGGSEYGAAIFPVQIMALYPLHQAYGQIAGSIFHATGRTHILRNLAAIEFIYGFIIVWVLLAPPELLGLHLGAVGLAIKTVGIQIITVNLYLLIASKFVPLALWRNILHQIWSVTILLIIAFACRELTIMAGLGDLQSAVRFIFSGCVYTIVCFLLCLVLPQILGMSRKDIYKIQARFLNHIYRVICKK